MTNAYRKQQEEVKKYREQEAEEAAFNNMTSVQNQKMWQMGMGRTLLNDIARDPTAIKQRKEQKKNVRKRMEESPEREGDEEKKEKEVKKSIYSDEEDEEKPQSPRQKLFEGELKPGLNTTTKKATTHAERIRQRNFTPTPPSSDDEGASALPRRRRSPSKERRSMEKSVKKEEEEEDVKPEVRKMSLKEKLKPKRIDKAARLKGLKEILKQRNTEEDIEEARQRYLERREQGVVVPPL